MNRRLLSLSAAIVCMAQSSIAQKQHELTAASVREYDPIAQTFSLIDSAAFKHSSGRNSKAVQYDDIFYTWDSLRYDVADVYKYPNGAPAELYQRRSMQFNTNGLRQEHVRQAFVGQTLVDNDREQHTYTLINGKQVLTQTVYQIYKNNSWTNSYRQSYSYDNQGRYIQGVGDSWTNNAWAHMRRDTTWYDNNGNVTRKVDWLVANQSPIPQMDMRFVYNTNNQLTSDSAYSFFEVVSAGTYTYNGQGLVEAHRFDNRNIATNTWAPAAELHYTYGAYGNVHSRLYKIWDATAAAFIDDHVMDYTYTANGQLVSIYGPIYWDGSAFTAFKAGTRQERFYYSAFPLSVADKVAGAMQLSVYPSPAVNSINISLDLATAQPVIACIISSDGRMVKQWADAKTQQYSKNISVADMPAGNYHLVMNAGNQRFNKTFTVVR